MTIADWKPLDREQAEALFAEHAVLLGKCDSVPVHIAAQIVPQECVEHVRGGNHGGEYWNAAGFNSLIPDGMVHWLTRSGFMAAISAANALYYWPEQRAAYMEHKTEKKPKSKKEETTC